MKITLEMEEGEPPVDGYPVVMENVKEFILVGTRAGPLGERLEIKHVRRMGDTVGLRSLAFGVIELLRDTVAREAHGIDGSK